MTFRHDSNAKVLGDSDDRLEIFASQLLVRYFKFAVFNYDFSEAGEDLAAAGEVVESSVKIRPGEMQVRSGGPDFMPRFIYFVRAFDGHSQKTLGQHVE